MDGEGGRSTDLTIVFSFVNDASCAENDSKKATPRDSVSGNVTEPNASDAGGDDLIFSNLNGRSLDGYGVSITALPSGAVLTIGTDGDYTHEPKTTSKPRLIRWCQRL